MPELLIEIGCEELPSTACREAEAQLPALLDRSLGAAGLACESPRFHVGPRRLAATATVPAERAAAASEVRGPRADAPEQARQGFARTHGLSADQLEQRGDGFFWAV